METLLPEKVIRNTYFFLYVRLIFCILMQEETFDFKLKDAHSSLDELDVDDLYVRYKVC